MEKISLVELAARCAHEANRHYCVSIGDDTQKPWDESPEWQRDSAIKGTLMIHDDRNTTPNQSHEGWLKVKEDEGWKYGPVKDVDKKEHPCFVPYDELPAAQRLKDSIFGGVIRAVLDAGMEPV